MFTQAARLLPTSTSASFSAAARSGRLVSTKSLVDSMAPILAMHKVTIQPANLELQVDAGESVLAAARRQGVMRPDGCKNGAWGWCKGTIVSGEVDYGRYHARGRTEAEGAHGKALFCQAKPLGELVIECRTIGAAKDI